ncbi:hypothetical protein J4227_07980 [Candidatus Woesearchaeota archaeon]|nr:hypothetical protein [Candidatus Woesearchaeota archaeon]
MAKAMKEEKKWELALLALILGTLGLMIGTVIAATPEGPTVTLVGNTTRSASGSSIVNYTGGTGQNTSGGYIFGINLAALQTNARWKAYYGNVTGTLTLDDAAGNTIYNWPLPTSSLTGYVYATRAAGSVTWASVACATVPQIETENFAINHSANPNDNITATFNSTLHTAFTVAGTSLSNCRSTSTFKNDSRQTQTSADDFQEIVIHDGTNVIYGTNIETNVWSYNNGTADFQILVPENGLAAPSGSIAYYFYVELT